MDLLEGTLVDLLHAKWNSFVKFRFYRQFFLFLFYFLISLVCFTLRPGPPPKDEDDDSASASVTKNITANISALLLNTVNKTENENITLLLLSANDTADLLGKTLLDSLSTTAISDFH